MSTMRTPASKRWPLILGAMALLALGGWLLHGRLEARRALEPVFGLEPQADGVQAENPALARVDESGSEAISEPDRLRISLLQDAPPASEVDVKRLEGQVSAAPSGRPVSAAQVFLGDEFGEKETSTDPQGRFALDWSRPAPGMRIEHPDYVDVRRPLVDFQDLLEVVLQESGGVAGRLVALGGPLPLEAEIHLWAEVRGKRSEEPIGSSAIDEYGAYSLSDVTPGTYAVGLAEPGLPIVIRAGVQVEAGQVTNVDLELPPGVEITGKVLIGVTRLPAPEVHLRFQPEIQGLGNPMERRAIAESWTDEDGSFRLTGVPDGQNVLWVRTPWGHRQRSSVQTVAGQDPKPLTVVIAAPATLAGYVRDQAGAPVADALVVRCLADEMSNLPWGSPAELEIDGIIAKATRTDRNGAFDLGEVPGRQRLFVLAYAPGGGGGYNLQGEVVPAFQSLSLQPGTARKDLDLVLRQGWPLEGLVQTVDGTPIPGVIVQPKAKLERAWTELGEVRTGSDGRFRIEGLPEGPLSLRFEHEDYLVGRQRLVSSEDAEPIEVELVEAYGVRGVVVDSEGYAVPDARAIGRLDDPRSKVRRSTSTDEYGRFHMQGLEEGTWFMSASAPGWQHPPDAVVPIELPGEAEVILVAERVQAPAPSSVTGEIRLASTGAPITGLRFNGLRSGSVEIRGTRFHIRGMRPGALNLVASGEHVEPYPFPRADLPPGAQLDVGSVELRGVTNLVVSVRDEGKNLRKNARVWLQRLPLEEGGRPVGSKRLPLEFRQRNKGHVLRAVPRYHWMLHVQQDGLVPYRKPLKVHGKSQQVVVQMQAKRKGR